MSQSDFVRVSGVTAQREPGAIPARSAGDSEFWRLFDASRPKLRLIAAGVLGGVTDADDVVHEAAMVGLAKFGSFTPGTNFDAWMGQITRLTALGTRRSRVRSAGATGSSVEHLARRPGPVTSEVAMETGRRLDAAMAVLDETARSCLLLRVVGGLDYDAISTILSIPKGTAMSHVSRARFALRGELERDPTWDARTDGGGS